MKILITGAKGMVAQATADHCRSIGDEVVALTRTELDIANAENVRSVVEEHRPDAIINCAAYTNVDGAEGEPERAYAANVTGVENLAKTAKEFGAVFVTISTDYVFDGANGGFYFEGDEPNPQGIYAKTKRKGELAALNANERSIVVRSGWIYGKGGTNFLSVMADLLRDGKRIKAIRDSFGTPTFAGDLAARLRELAELDEPGIFHVTNSGPGTSYLGFAEAVCEMGGFDATLIESVSKDELRRPAPRPASSKLGSLRCEEFGLAPMPDWEDALLRSMNGIQAKYHQ